MNIINLPIFVLQEIINQCVLGKQPVLSLMLTSKFLHNLIEEQINFEKQQILKALDDFSKAIVAVPSKTIEIDNFIAAIALSRLSLDQRPQLSQMFNPNTRNIETYRMPNPVISNKWILEIGLRYLWLSREADHIVKSIENLKCEEILRRYDELTVQLLKAIIDENLFEVEAIIEKGVNVNTLIHFGVKLLDNNTQNKLVKKLQLSSIRDLQDYFSNWYFMDLATSIGNVNIITILLKKKCYFNNTLAKRGGNFPTPPMMHAIYEDRIDILMIFLKYLKEDFKDEDRWNELLTDILFKLISLGKLSILKTLYNNFEEVREKLQNRDEANEFFLQAAGISRGRAEILRFIVDKGNIDINTPVRNGHMEGKTVMHMVFFNTFDLGALKALANCKEVNINARDVEGNTPLHVALQENEKRNVLEILLKREDINLNLQNNQGSTVFHMAICSQKYPSATSNLDFLKLIYEKNIPIDHKIQDNQGRIPLDLAEEVLNSESEELAYVRKIVIKQEERLHNNKSWRSAYESSSRNWCAIL